MADLARVLTCPFSVDFMGVASYAGQSSIGTVRLSQDLADAVTDRHVVLVDDILDTGRTLRTILDMLHARGPASVRIVCLLRKTGAQIEPIEVDYLGFTIPNVFVVGYGLDLDGRHRGLPYIAAVDGARPE